MNHLLLILVSTLSFASPAVNYTEAPECSGRPDFITEVRPEIIGGFEKLPSMLLVARDAEYYIESKEQGQNVKIHSYQSFQNAGNSDSKIVCGSALKNSKKIRYSLFAPTLIDATAEKKVGQTLWQFQMLAAPNGFSVWNQRSLAFTKQESLEKNLMSYGGNYQIYQLSPKQYEIVVSKTTGTVQQYLSVKFDAVSSL